MALHKPLGGKILTKTFLVCSVLALIALYFIGKRFIFGLGAVTNMNDAMSTQIRRMLGATFRPDCAGRLATWPWFRRPASGS